MSSFSKAVAVILKDKYKGGTEKVIAKAQANATSNLLTIYRNTVNSVVSYAVDTLSDDLSHGYTGLSPGLRYDKRAYPAYQNKFWRFSGKTSVAFRKEKNIFLQKVKASKSTSKVIRSILNPHGRTVTLRLFSGMPEWNDLGMEQLIMGEFRENSKRDGVPWALRNLYFNEYGVAKRRRGGVHPARPVIRPAMNKANKLLISRLSHLIR